MVGITEMEGRFHLFFHLLPCVATSNTWCHRTLRSASHPAHARVQWAPGSCSCCRNLARFAALELFS